MAVIIIFLLIEVQTKTLPALSALTENCKATENIVKSITNQHDETLLIVMDPVQNYFETYSLKAYLHNLNSMPIYKYDFIKRNNIFTIYSDTIFYNSLMKESENKLGMDLIGSADKSQVSKILVFSGLNDTFAGTNADWLNEANFKREQFGEYMLYSKMK